VKAGNDDWAGGCKESSKLRTRFPASAFLLAALFVVLLVLELAPTAVVATTDGLWFMAVPEDFTKTLWSPLRPLSSGGSSQSTSMMTSTSPIALTRPLIREA
jgi:hypothetical protein